MERLLYITASPRAERSHSIAVADAFVRSYTEANPDDEIVRVDVFERPLISFDGLVVRAKYAILHGEQPSGEERSAWQAVEETVAEFKSADKYAMAVPMWNFSIPYRLKRYIDILVQPGYTFAVTPGGGYEGLVVGKPVFIAYARGGEYAAGTGYEEFDLQTKYLETILAFMGFTDIRSVLVEPTVMAGAEIGRSKRALAIDLAIEMAREF